MLIYVYIYFGLFGLDARRVASKTRFGARKNPSDVAAADSLRLVIALCDSFAVGGGIFGLVLAFTASSQQCCVCMLLLGHVGA